MLFIQIWKQNKKFFLINIRKIRSKFDRWKKNLSLFIQDKEMKEIEIEYNKNDFICLMQEKKNK